MKKGMLSALALAVLATGLMVGVPSSSVAAPAARAKQPATHAKAPAYRHYVACGFSRQAKPAHHCSPRSKKAAFFKSLRGDVFYKVCIKFPTRGHLCTNNPQEAVRGTLYFNEITATSRGRYGVTWFVKGKKVGTTVFRVR